MTELEILLTRLVYFYCTDLSFGQILIESGVELEKILRPEFVATDLFREFEQAKAKSNSHTFAQNACKQNIKLIENFYKIQPIDQPTNPEYVSAAVNLFKNQYETKLLAKRLEANPDSAQELLDEYNQDIIRPVEINWLEDWSKEFIKSHNSKILENKVTLKIPGFELLSEMIGGFNSSRIGLLTGSTGFGKTNFGLTLSLRARAIMSTLYVNMEMSRDDILKRVSVISTGETYVQTNKSEISNKAKDEFVKFPRSLAFTSGRSLSIKQIRSSIKKAMREAKIGLVIVDYDQKLELSISRETPEWKTLQIAIETLEDFAKEFECYVLVLAQVNREGEISGSFRAMFPAHTVLAFENHEDHGPIIQAKKNRHGKKNQALKVFYDESNSLIRENEIITIEKKKKSTTTLRKPDQPRGPYID